MFGAAGKLFGSVPTPTPWDIRNLVTTGRTMSYLSETAGGTRFTFGDSGSKIYVQRDTFNINEVYQYNLTVAWDISTGSYASKTFNTTPETINGVAGIYLSSDGTKMYICSINVDEIFQYTLSTPWDVSTASYAAKSLDPSTEDSQVGDFSINEAGTRIYVLGRSNNRIYQYTMSSPDDISTASYDSKSFDHTSEAADVFAMWMDPTGTYLFLFEPTSDKAFRYTFGTPGDLDTLSYDSMTVDLSSEDPTAPWFYIKADGINLYMLQGSVDEIEEYRLQT